MPAAPPSGRSHSDGPLLTILGPGEVAPFASGGQAGVTVTKVSLKQAPLASASPVAGVSALT
ncbi:MAG: hypothetical protein Q8M22_19825, partial [Actinomycetota bacterium]|nr:hypothetical protein [Actinomycetota bacterium]